MLDLLFENRNKTLGNLIKLGDALGRSIRENVIIFSVDSEENTVTYLSESGNFVTGYYDTKTLNPRLSKIKLLNSEIMNETNNFDSFVSKKVRSFIKDLNEDKVDNASVSFNEVLSLWEGRLKLESYQKKLFKKKEVVREKTSILDTEEYKHFIEIKESLIKFIKDNRDTFEKIDEIKNTVTLSTMISNAFDLPKIELASLEGNDFSYSENNTGTLYEMICRQELLRKELLESKKEFKSVWVGSNKVSNLMGFIYESTENIEKALAEAIAQVPYLALASKSQLRELFTDSIAVNETISISTKEITSFASKIFEMKKPIKKEIIKVLNNKYGINMQNLKETASFKSLVNTQIVLFETMAKLSPANSVQKKVLSEVSTMLKNKAGVEALDLNDDILSIFEESEVKVVSEASVESYLDFNKIANDIDGITSILRMIQQKVGGAGGMDAGMEQTDMVPGAEQPGLGQPGMGQPETGVPGMSQPGMGQPETGVPGMSQPGMGMPPNPVTNPDPMADGDLELPAAGPEDDDIAAPGMNPEEVPVESEEDIMAAGLESGAEEGLPSEEPEVPSSGDDLMANIADLQSLIDDLTREIQGEEMGGEEGLEGEEFGEEGLEGGEEEGIEYGDKPEFEDAGEEGAEEGLEDENGAPEQEEEDEESPQKERPKGKKKFKLSGKDKVLPQEKVD
jgi:hypothetical protein